MAAVIMSIIWMYSPLFVSLGIICQTSLKMARTIKICKSKLIIIYLRIQIYTNKYSNSIKNNTRASTGMCKNISIR